MTDRSRWGFEALDDTEYEQFLNAPSSGARRSGPATPTRGVAADDQGLHDRESDADLEGAGSLVEVVLDDDGQVVRVRVASRWRDRVDPSSLGREVAAAVNRSATQRLSHTVPAAAGGGADRDVCAGVSPGVGPRPTAGVGEGTVDLGAWGGSLERLVAEAQRDLTSYEHAHRQLRSNTVVARSVSGAVSVAGRAGLVDAVEIDPLWLRRARHDEIENELCEVLARVRADLAPAATAAGPAAPATRTLIELARRPVELLRAAGLDP